MTTSTLTDQTIPGKSAEGRQLRGGVIGFGKMGLLHAALVNTIEDSTLCAVCEPNPIVTRSIENYASHIACHKNYKTMLDKEKLDFVFITTPPASHVPIALECIERGIHFFVEKPLSVLSHEAEPLIAALAKKPVINMVGFMMRYHSTYRKAKEILESGILGKPLSVNATMYVSQMFAAGRGWRFNRSESGGGSLISQAVHVVDLLTWYFGVPDEVNARTIAPYSGGVEDFGHAMLHWNSGILGSLDSSWSMDNHRLLDTRILITTDLGTLIVDDDYVRVYIRDPEYGKPGQVTEYAKPDLFVGAPVDIGGTHFTHQDEDFISAIRANRPIECDVESGANVQKVIDSIYESATSHGRPVQVKTYSSKRVGFWSRIKRLFKSER